MKLSQYNLKCDPNHLSFSQVINHIAGDGDDETYLHKIKVNKQVNTHDTCTQTEAVSLKEHIELVNKINDETNNSKVELSDTDGKTHSIAEIIDMDLPELIKLSQKVPDLEINKNFLNFLYRNYKVLYKSSQIIRRHGDAERIHITLSLFDMHTRIPRRTNSTFWDSAQGENLSFFH